MKGQKNPLLGYLRKEVCARLEDNKENVSFLASLVTILSCETWDTGDDDYGGDDIEDMMKRFITPLRNAGFAASAADLINQWKDMMAYIIKNLYN